MPANDTSNERLAIGEDDDITTSSSVKHQEAKEDPRKANELPPAKHKRLVKENPVFLEEEAEEEENRGKANKTPAKKKSTPQQMQCKSKEKNQVAQANNYTCIHLMNDLVLLHKNTHTHTAHTQRIHTKRTTGWWRH